MKDLSTTILDNKFKTKKLHGYQTTQKFCDNFPRIDSTSKTLQLRMFHAVFLFSEKLEHNTLLEGTTGKWNHQVYGLRYVTKP